MIVTSSALARAPNETPLMTMQSSQFMQQSSSAALEEAAAEAAAQEELTMMALQKMSPIARTRLRSASAIAAAAKAARHVDKEESDLLFGDSSPDPYISQRKAASSSPGSSPSHSRFGPAHVSQATFDPSVSPAGSVSGVYKKTSKEEDELLFGIVDCQSKALTAPPYYGQFQGVEPGIAPAAARSARRRPPAASPGALRERLAPAHHAGRGG